MAQEERDRVKNDLEAKEKELKKAQDEQAQLSTKLQVCVVYHYSALYCMISVYMKQQSCKVAMMMVYMYMHYFIDSHRCTNHFIQCTSVV